MGRAPCCEKVGLKRGRWTAEEDEILINYIRQNGDGSWRSLPKNAGLLRCGKSCRLRWINYLREDLKRGNFTREEEETIIKLHRSVGNKWSLIASNLPGRTDNEVKNYWNSHLSRKIYSFRSCHGSLLTTMDMVKMANNTTTTAPPSSRRKGGRVSRAVAKKYNMNAMVPSSRSKLQKVATTAAENAQVVGAVGSAEEGTRDQELNNVVIHDNVERESINIVDDFNTNDLLEEFLVENEVQGSNNTGQTEDLASMLEQILQGDLMELSEISLQWEETGKKSMDLESVSVNNESHNGAISLSDTGDNMYECSSPINSYFDQEMPLSWDKEYGVQEFQLWDEGDDLLWP